MNNSHRSALNLLLGVAAATLLGGCGFESRPASSGPSGNSDATLTVSNRSHFILREVHLAEVRNDNWGPDLLSHDLRPGDELVLESVPCGSYDVLVVDETNTDCTLHDLRLCFSDSTWAIDDQELDSCAFGMGT